MEQGQDGEVVFESKVKGKFKNSSKNYHAYEVGERGGVVVGQVYVNKLDMDTPPSEVEFEIKVKA